jgi:hypothetical protein
MLLKVCNLLEKIKQTENEEKEREIQNQRERDTYQRGIQFWTNRYGISESANSTFFIVEHATSLHFKTIFLSV